MKLGLTGGIGCGKSTAGTFLQQAGWLRVDADAVVHHLLDTDAQVQDALRAHFGPEALIPPSALPPQSPPPTTPPPPAPPAPTNATPTHATPALRANRRLLAERIFADPAERGWLERLLHPLVRHHWEQRLAEAGNVPIVVEIPLLFEKNLEKHFDLTVCVEADHHVQLARLQSRGMSPADAEARIASQMPLAQKIARADKILSNNGTTDFLHAQVLHLSNGLLALSPSHTA